MGEYRRRREGNWARVPSSESEMERGMDATLSLRFTAATNYNALEARAGGRACQMTAAKCGNCAGAKGQTTTWAAEL